MMMGNKKKKERKELYYFFTSIRLVTSPSTHTRDLRVYQLQQKRAKFGIHLGRSLADDWEDNDSDDWEAVADDLDAVNINDDDKQGLAGDHSKASKPEEVQLSTDEIFARLKEKLVVDSHNLCKALGVATGVKVRTSKSANEQNLESADLQAVKKIVEAKVKVYKAQQKAIEDRKKKEEEDKLKKAAPAKKKKKKKKKKKRVYSVYEDEDDPDLWDGLDETSELYHEALTHKSSRNFGKGDWQSRGVMLLVFVSTCESMWQVITSFSMVTLKKC